MSTEYGYVRVSSRDQNEARQLAALAEQGIPPRNIFIDKQSGKDFDRPAWRLLLRRLRKGDVLFVGSIDRLGRNYAEILKQWRHITMELHAHIVVLDMSLLDTRAGGNDLTGTFISDLVLQILAYVAQTEREHIHRRQAEGIAAAKRRGVQFGRAPVSTPKQFVSCLTSYRRGDLSGPQAARACGMSYSTFYRNALRRHD